MAFAVEGCVEPDASTVRFSSREGVRSKNCSQSSRSRHQIFPRTTGSSDNKMLSLVEPSRQEDLRFLSDASSLVDSSRGTMHMQDEADHENSYNGSRQSAGGAAFSPCGRLGLTPAASRTSGCTLPAKRRSRKSRNLLLSRTATASCLVWTAGMDLHQSVRADSSEYHVDLTCKGTQREYEGCEIEPCEVKTCMDCVWSEWAPYSACTCEGLRERHRVIAQQSNSCGKPCDGPKVETATCTPDCHHNPQDCVLSEWSSWSSCSKDCGGGQKNRTRVVVTEAAHLGKPCSGSLVETEACNDAACVAKRDCELSYWSSWGECSKSCGGGQQNRTRTVTATALAGGKPCSGGLVELQACSLPKCETDLDCIWNEWQEWSACSRSCGIGSRARSRMIEQAPRGHGKLCEPLDMVETAACDMGLCHEAVDCLFEPWTSWGECSKSCHGVQERTRHIAVYPAHDGAACEGNLKELQGCNNEGCIDESEKVPVNCELSAWKPWAECSKSCGGGERTRSREVVQEPKNGGDPCDGVLAEMEPCNVEICPEDVVPKIDPVDCAWSEWESWGQCSNSCGVGQKFRKRRIVQLPNNLGKPCSANDSMEVAECNLASCLAVDCVWSEWSAWSDCTCSGLRERHREISQHYAGDGKPCEGAKVETKECHADCYPDPIDCVLSGWADWSTCSHPCGGGQKKRTRKVNTLPQYGGKDCASGLEEVAPCSTEPCEHPSDCVMGDWTDWGKCSATCGGGEQHRARKVVKASKHGGRPCSDETSEVRGCGMDPCKAAVDCRWGEWSEFDECSKTCGGGQRTRTRHVETSPRNGGKLCDALTTEEVAPCNTESCEEKQPCRDGQWGPWSRWSLCSATCGEGYRVRHRQVGVEPNYCGAAAHGQYDQYEKCNLGPCNTGKQDCEFGEWQKWEPCSSNCNGIHTRERLVSQYAKDGGSPCTGATKQIGPCNTGHCKSLEPVDCVLGEWSAWDECTAACEGGSQARSRTIVELPKRGGKPCEGALDEVRACNEERCRATQDCKWSIWGEWGSCSKPCGGGERTRFRHIMKNPRHGGKACDAKEAGEMEPCNVHHCGHREYCVWSHWGQWGECNKSCGKGTRHRQRKLEISMSHADAETALSTGIFSEIASSWSPGNFYTADHLAFTFLIGMASSVMVLFVIYQGGVRLRRRSQGDDDSSAAALFLDDDRPLAQPFAMASPVE
ncbi:unnamed protein product [Amoebophrya sp. A120]|nr:unnamed protein product [Amoebophrya sp. A120]|eukprot:GSA120T00010879001.1